MQGIDKVSWEKKMKGRIIGFKNEKKPQITVEIDTAKPDDIFPLNGEVEIIIGGK